MKYTKGFSLIEIMIAFAIILIVFVAVFHFVSSLYVYNNTIDRTHEVLPDFSYQYGEPYCMVGANNADIVFLTENQISFESYISTSTKITSIHHIAENNFLLTTDSASTSESDMFIFAIDIATKSITHIQHIDAGPGIRDSKLLDRYVYVANTSVNSHVKSFFIDMSATGTSMFKEISNIKLPTLALSSSLPKRLSIYDRQLILGSEKSNSGGELFVLPIDTDGGVRTVRTIMELNGQAHQDISAYHSLYVANAGDPELKVFNQDFDELFSYDAPLTLGNGKSVVYIEPYIVLGRTLGSGELSLLRKTGTTTKIFDTKRTYGTVDYLQRIGDTLFLAVTGNEEKELQLWNIVQDKAGAKLQKQKEINIPGRVTSYTCVDSYMYMSLIIHNQPTLIWIKL